MDTNTINTTTSKSIVDVSTSREEIRKKLLEEYSKIFLVSGKQLDNSDSAFNTYVLNALSYHLSDLLYYTTFLYRESTLVTSELPDTILNWSTYLDYMPKKAVPAKVNLLIQMDLGGQDQLVTNPSSGIPVAISAVIPRGHNFYAGNNIVFKSKYETKISVNGTEISIRVIKEDGEYSVPYNVNIVNDKSVLSFLIEAEQYEEQEYEFIIPQLQPFEYFYKKIQLPHSDDNIVDIKVLVSEPAISDTNHDGVIDDDDRVYEIWPERKLALLTPNEKGFEAIVTSNGVELLFGNGAFGKQPKGILKVILKVTKGESGNVMAGTIQHGDEMISDFVVAYSVINTEEAEGGRNFETLDEIKRNSISSLKMIKRIVSREDYVNLPDVLEIDTNIVSEPILKRSDLTCNDVDLYLVINYNKKIAWTNSIPIKLPYDTDVELKPQTIFNYEDKEWICPFTIKTDLDKKVVNYFFVKPFILFTFNTTYKKTDPQNHDIAKSILSKCSSEYLSEYDMIQFESYIVVTDVAYNTFRQTLTLVSPSGNIVMDPDNTEFIENNNIMKFTYKKLRKDVENVNKIIITNYETNINSGTEVISTQYESTNEIQFSLNNITYSHIIGDNPSEYLGLDVPVFEKTYWDGLTRDEQNKIQLQAISDLIQRVNEHDTRMMNVNISGKFAKTIGKTYNIKYSEPDYCVEGIFTQPADIPDPTLQEYKGKFIAISDINDTTYEYYTYSGNILFSDGVRWVPKRVGRGTLIRNNLNNLIYATDGRRWVLPYYDLPLKFTIEVHSNAISNTLVDKCKNLVVDYVNSRGIQNSIYLSKITDLLHNLDDVNYVRIIHPETDIIYRDLIKNMKKEDMYFYTPEYVYTTKQDVEIIPIII